MDEAFLIELLINNISLQLRHPNYWRSLEVAGFAHSISTGENQSEYIHRYRRTEDAEQKAQRERLYNPMTALVLNRPRKYWKKMGRVQGISENFEADDAKALAELRADFEQFQAGYSLNEWLNYKLESLGVTDPNAWIVYERFDKRDVEENIEQTNVYPLCVPAADVLNLEEDFGQLKWLIIRIPKLETIIDNGMRREVWMEDFYLYSPELTIRAREQGQLTKIEPRETAHTIEVYPLPLPKPANPEKRKRKPEAATDLNTTKQRQFFIRSFEQGAGEVPAACVGAYPEEGTRGRAFVTWFYPAKHVFFDLIRDKVYLDVTKTLHVYAKRYEYVGACRFKDKTLGECVRGYLGGISSKPCPDCKGTGKISVFSTEQSAVQMIMPERQTDLLELAKLSHYETLPMELPVWLDGQVEKDAQRVMDAVLSPGVLQRATGQEGTTATEVNYAYEDLYDLLHPFGRTHSAHFELAFRVGARYREIKNFKVNQQFPKDYKLKTLEDLLAEYEAAKASGVGYDVLQRIFIQILRKQHEDDPKQLNAILARYQWLPFSDKAPEEVAAILSARSPLDPTRILRDNWVEIFKEIEANPGEVKEGDLTVKVEFYQLSFDRQKEVVDAKVAEFATRILVASAPEPLPTGGEFNDKPNGKEPEDKGAV